MAAGSPVNLLGAHVVGRPEELAGEGQAGQGQQVGIGGAGHAEVEDLRLTGLLHEDVGGLEVAVDDAPVVGVLHRVADPRHQAQRGRRVEAVAVGVLVQGQAADELHGEEGLAVVGQAGLVDLRDAGVVQPGQDLGLVGEALDQGGGGEPGSDDLEGDGAARVVLLRLVDGTHAALGDQAQNAVVPHPHGRDRGPRRGRRLVGPARRRRRTRTNGLFSKPSSPPPPVNSASHASRLSNSVRRAVSPAAGGLQERRRAAGATRPPGRTVPGHGRPAAHSSPRPAPSGTSASRRASQARAKRHSRARVLAEIPRTAAVSSALSPAK